MVLLEFTVEPFQEGSLGPHVRAAVDAAESFGVSVDIGPFGSSCVVAQAQAAAVAGAIVAAAFGNGASHVSLHAARVGGEE